MKIDTPLTFELAQVGDMARELETAGFDGAYTFEGKNDPFIAVAAAAMSTTKIDLMTAIAVAFARNPMSLAYLGNDLQLLSGGRFIMGLGTQVKAHIERRFSMPWGKPAQRMREMVLAIRAIWDAWETGGQLNYHGEYYQHTLTNPAFTPGRNPHGMPKIYIAGVGPLMTEIAAEVGDGYCVHPFHSATSLEQLSLPALQRGLDAAGKHRKDLAISAQVMTATGSDDAQLQAAIAATRNRVAFYGSTPAYKPVLEVHGWDHMQAQWLQMTREGRWADMADSVTDDMLETFAVVGTPADVAQKLAKRCQGRIDRLSPVIYQPDSSLLSTLLKEIRAAL